MVTVMTTAAAIATASRGTAAIATATTVATVATVTGNRQLLTAQEGDPDDREENRDPQHESTIHPEILQLKKYRNSRSAKKPQICAVSLMTTHS
jgi:hypothetical protein